MPTQMRSTSDGDDDDEVVETGRGHSTRLTAITIIIRRRRRASLTMTWRRCPISDAQATWIGQCHIGPDRGPAFGLAHHEPPHEPQQQNSRATKRPSLVANRQTGFKSLQLRVRRGDDRGKVPQHQGQGRLRDLGQTSARPDRLLFLRSFTGTFELSGSAIGASEHRRRQLPTAEEIVPNAAVHVDPLRGQVRVVFASRRRCLHSNRQAGAASTFSQFRQRSLRGPGRSRQQRGVWSAVARVRRELLHGWSWSSSVQGDAEKNRPPYQVLFGEFVHHAWGRRTWSVCSQVCWHSLHLELRGNLNFFVLV